MQRVSKLEAASSQLDWAIRLLLDHDAPVAAITLAGAAEEVLGRSLGDEAVFKVLMESIPGKLGVDPKIYSQQHLNRARNWLKHWGSEEPEHAEIDLYEEAVSLILRALANYIPQSGGLSKEAERFCSWLPSYFQSS